MTQQKKPQRYPLYQHDFILIDGSGSMSSMWEDAIGGVNAYVKKLNDERVDTGVTVVVFDDNMGRMDFRTVRDRLIPEAFQPITNRDATPRGGTPLSDAVGRIVSLAESGGYDKVSIVIMTDGHENASREYSVSQAKAALDRCRQRDWAVTFLGANFQNDNQAAQYGNHLSNSVFTSATGLRDTFVAMGAKRAAYSSTPVGFAAGSTMSWSAEEKEEAAKK